MKMIMAIIQEPFVNDLIKALMDRDIRVTRLASTGGFFKTGNSTLLIGIPKEQVEEVVEVIRGVITKKRLKSEDVHAVNMFILDVDDFHKV